MNGFWHWMGENWLWVVIFGGGAAEWCGEKVDMGVGAWSKRRRRKLAQQAEDRALKVQAMQAEIEAKAPAKPVCQCGHGLAFHDLKSSKCSEFRDEDREQPCLCRRYIGPEPLTQFYAPDIIE